MLLMLTTCGTPDRAGDEVSATAEVNTFGWLTGHWQRGDDKPGRTTFEYWEKTTPALYAGLAYRMVEGDTVWQEDMRLYQTGTSWTLEVSGEGDKILFKVKEIIPTGFESTNPKHDFPKVISYELRGDSLYAVISGDGKEVPFTFGRKE